MKTLEKAIDKLESKLEIAEDGKLSMNDIVSLLLKSEDAPINRNEFLKETLSEKYDRETVDRAIETSPIQAGISVEELRQLCYEQIAKAKDDIKISTAIKDAVAEEKKIDKVKGIIDSVGENRIVREMLKTEQKILYAFGFPQIKISEQGTISDARARLVMLIGLATMYDTADADCVLKAIAKVIPELPDNVMLLQNLDKEEIGKIIMKWRKKFIAAFTAMKATESNPLLNAAAKTGNVVAIFDKNMHRLIDAVSDTFMTNPNHVATEKETAFANMIIKAAE